MAKSLELEKTGLGSIIDYNTTMFDVGDEVEGIDIVLPKISIAKDVQVFKFPDGTKDSFKGIIINISKYNIYWSKSYTEESGSPPDCFSNNGIFPDPNCSDIQSSKCFNCPKNQFGSAPNGRGKACNNRKMIHVLVEDSIMPYKISISATNIKTVDMYVSLLWSKKMSYKRTLTEFSLVKGSSKDGLEFSKLALKSYDYVTDNKEVAFLDTFIGKWLPIIKGNSIKDAETESDDLEF